MIKTKDLFGLLFFIVIVVIMIFGTFSYWKSLKHIYSIDPNNLLKIHLSNEKVIDSIMARNEEALEELHNILSKSNINDNDNKFLEDFFKVHNNQLNKLHKDYQKTNVFEFQEEMNDIYKGMATAAKLNIERSTVSFFFIIGSAFLLSIFLVFFNISIKKYELITDTYKEFKYQKKEISSKLKINKEEFSIQTLKYETYSCLWRINLLQYMDYNSIFDTISDLLGKVFEDEEKQYVKYTLKRHKNAILENVPDDRKDNICQLIEKINKKFQSPKVVAWASHRPLSWEEKY